MFTSQRRPRVLKDRLLACHSQICRGSFLKGHVAENVTVPPDDPLRSHFQRACGRCLTRGSLFSVSVCLRCRERPSVHAIMPHLLLGPSTALRFRCRHQLSVPWSCVFLCNRGVTCRSHVRHQASLLASSLFAFKVNPAPSLSSSFPRVQNELQWKIQTEVDGYLMFVERNRAVCRWFGAVCYEKKESLSILPFKYQRGGHVKSKS